MAGTVWARSCCLLLFIFSECLTTKITRLQVPSEVDLEDAETTDVVLDCEYEVESDEGLVLVWYFNDEIIYQWIVGDQPTTKDSYKKNVHIGYNISDISTQKYRALRLLNADKSFSGDYTCKVSTFVSEDSQKKHLQFYDAGDALNLTYSVQRGNETDSDLSVLVQCDVDRVYPQPELTIYIDGEMVNQTQTYEEAGVDGFNSTARASLPVSELAEGAQLRCDITLPHTTYNNSEKITYTEAEWTNEITEDDSSEGSAAAMEVATDTPNNGGAATSAVTSLWLTSSLAILLLQCVLGIDF